MSKYIPKHIFADGKRCTKCERILPLSEFDEAPTNEKGLGLKDHCRECHAKKAEQIRKAEAERRLAEISKQERIAGMTKEEADQAAMDREAKALLEKHMPKPGRDRIDAPHVSEVLEASLRELKTKCGLTDESALQAYARMFVHTFTSALNENPAGIAAQRMHGIWHQLFKTSTEHRRSAPDVSEFFDDNDIWATIGTNALPAVPSEMLATQADRLADSVIEEQFYKRKLHLKIAGEDEQGAA